MIKKETDTRTELIELRPIRTEDIVKIKKWPPYLGGFEQMDYALRDNGWIDKFWNRPNTWIYVAEMDRQLIGFSLLSVTVEKDAEFRIAIHPDWTGKGQGRAVTLAMLKKGFQQLSLGKIHLIVRKNNHRASKLYSNIGFTKTGESIHTIQGKHIEFVDMSLFRERFDNLKIKENA